MRLLTALAYVAAVGIAFRMGREWEDEHRPFLAHIWKRLKQRAAVRLVAVLVALAGVVALTGCSGGVVDPVADASACYPPLACGAFYPVPVYPYAYAPYVGYLHDPAHVIITGAGPRTTVIYRPYSPPLRPTFVTPPRAAAAPPKAPAPPPAAKPAAPAPKPAAPKPAAPAARPAARTR